MPTRLLALRGAWAAACLAALFAGSLVPNSLPSAHAEHPVRGSTIEIEDFAYTFYLGGDGGWSLECKYRVDGGPWQTAAASGEGNERRLRLPGTSVHGIAAGQTVNWSCDDDVTRLWVGPTRAR